MAKKEIQIKDVIHQSTNLTTFLNLQIYKKYFFNKTYYPIIKMLKNGLKTVSEITDLYSSVKTAIMRDSVDYHDTIKIEQPKSENTIYHYIQDLIKAGLIYEAGRRIQSNQVSSKILYSQSAKLFLIDNSYSLNIWGSDQARTLASYLGLLLSPYLNNKNPVFPQLIEFILKYEQESALQRDNLLKRIAEQSASPLTSADGRLVNETIEEINQLDAEEFYGFHILLGELLWILSIEDLEEVNQHLISIFITEPSTENENLLRTSVKEDIDNGFQDIITFEPSTIKILDFDIWKAYKLPKYVAIIFMLRDGPMTIKEIHQKHHKAVTALIQKNFSDEKKDKNQGKKPKPIRIPKPKKENTIYRYVKDLIKADFLTEAGRRVLPNQTSTQLLYSRTAKIFITFGHRFQLIGTQKEKRVNKILGITLRHYFNKTNCDYNKLHLLISNFTKIKFQVSEQTLKQASEHHLLDLFQSLNDEWETFIAILSLLSWLITQKNKNSFREQLIDCFS
ncbi:MAG: hypothetical protein ACFFC7_24790 [Candidatus Hermodarchaeota archaeon]